MKKVTAIEIDPIFLDGVKDIPDSAIETFYRLGSPELWHSEMIRRGLLINKTTNVVQVEKKKAQVSLR